MSKFVIILLVSTFAACINADDSPDDIVNKLMSSGRNIWDDVMQMPEQAMDLGENAIKALPGIPNGVSSGSFQSFEHHTETKNGKVVSDGGFSKMITNNNGTVSEDVSTQ